MSDGMFHRSNIPERRAVTTGPSGRNWTEIGVGLAAGLAVIAMYLAGVWAVWVVVEAL